MKETGRRLAPRTPLRTPLEASLRVCRGDNVPGWIVEEQDDGLGMMFGAEDAERLLAHGTCCVEGEADLVLSEPGRVTCTVPVRLAHVTLQETSRVCRAGLSYDVRRFRPEDIARLLGLWRRLAETTRPDGTTTPTTRA